MNIVGEKAPSFKGGMVEVPCENCGKVLTRYPYRLKDNNHQFCDQQCAGEWRSRYTVGLNSAKYTSIEIECDYCSKTIIRKPSAVKDHNFCDHGCYGKWMAENLVGENNPLYKGGRGEYCEKFDDACRESNRDKYDRECFICGSIEDANITSAGKFQRLSVHHVDMNKDQGCDDHDWKLVPLCIHCHNMAHMEMWKSRIEYLLNNIYGDLNYDRK